MERQTRQRERHLNWLAQYGDQERPVQLATYLQQAQQGRIAWLRVHTVGTVLEVGCSWGYVLAQVNGHAGVDISPTCIATARLLARDRLFMQASALALPFETGAFDTVLQTEILEHLPWADVPRAIVEALRVARTRVLITLPDGAEDTAEAVNGKHQWLATPERLAELCALLPSTAVERDGLFVYIVCDK